MFLPDAERLGDEPERFISSSISPEASMRLSMATDLLNLRVASSFRAESSSPTFPASSKMRGCCFSEHFHARVGSIELSEVPTGVVCLTDDVDVVCEPKAPGTGVCAGCMP